MSANRIPPPFPQPFRNSNSAPNATGTEQRSIPPAQGFAYPPETHIPRGPPNGGPPQIPPRPPHSYAPIPPYQHTHGSVQTHPTSFPMPQVPYPHVPTIPSGPPPFMAQRSEATHVPSYMHNPPQYHVTRGRRILLLPIPREIRMTRTARDMGLAKAFQQRTTATPTLAQRVRLAVAHPECKYVANARSFPVSADEVENGRIEGPESRFSDSPITLCISPRRTIYF
ncbi:hypothetical protein EI94DRAFT_138968 [Lactarius quietus]|nr:hypothetical protein EI94DRAFT_138968 [Lactarius quietus]